MIKRMRTHILVDHLPSSPLFAVATARADRIEHIARERLSVNRDKLFLPDLSFYQLETNEQLVDSAWKILKWIGVKPHNLTICYTELSTPVLYSQQLKKHTIYVHSHFRKRPYQAAALLAHALMHYVLIGKLGDYQPDEIENEQTADELAMQTGLGIIYLNATGNPYGWLAKIEDIRLHPRAGYDLVFNDATKPFRDFKAHTNEYRIHPETYNTALTPWAYKQLFAQTANNSPLHAVLAIKQARRSNIKTSFIVATAFAVLGLLAFALNISPKDTTNNQAIHQQQLQILQSRYEKCDEEALALRKSINNDDILQIQAADAKDRECIDILTTFNHQKRLYNEQTAKKP